MKADLKINENGLELHLEASIEEIAAVMEEGISVETPEPVRQEDISNVEGILSGVVSSTVEFLRPLNARLADAVAAYRKKKAGATA